MRAAPATWEERAMAEEETGSGGHDQSPREQNRDKSSGPDLAEVSNWEIVSHYFDDRCRPARRPEEIRAVLKWSYREVQVQIPVVPRRREAARLLRLSRAAQRRPRALQGRRALPPRGGPRRGPRARVADDVEDRDRRHPLRRREGRRELSGGPDERARAAAVARGFMDKIEKVLGPNRDIPAPDVTPTRRRWPG